MKRDILNDKSIPEKTVERLLMYRVILSELLEQKQEYIRSHELAKLANNKAEQVRRDIMSVYYIGNPAKGYEINKLLNTINEELKLKTTVRVGIIGVGRLGTAIFSFLKEHSTRFEVSAIFDIDTGKRLDCTNFFGIEQLQEIIEKNKITFIILSVPARYAQNVTDILNKTNIKGILNFTPALLKVRKGITVNRVDISLEMEKLVFYSH